MEPKGRGIHFSELDQYSGVDSEEGSDMHRAYAKSTAGDELKNTIPRPEYDAERRRRKEKDWCPSTSAEEGVFARVATEPTWPRLPVF